jgi:tetratricopeptide (TPR) repeat protein
LTRRYEADVTLRDEHVESLGYSMHSCVHSWTKHIVNEEWDNNMARLVLSCVGLHVPNSNRPPWVVEQRLVGHANRCEEYLGRGLAGQDDVVMLRAIHRLGDLYFNLSKLDEAEELYRRALAGYEKALGRDHTSTLGTVNNLGLLYKDLGRLEEAEQLYERVLQGREAVLHMNLAPASPNELLLKDRASLDVHDTSDLISILSFDGPPSLTSGSTLSDTSWIAKATAQQFVEILIGDAAMQPLFSVVVKRAGLDKFRRNFFRLLKQYAVDLRTEATNPIHYEAARLVKSRANFIVHRITDSVRHEETSTQLQFAASELDKERDLERFLQQQVEQTQQYCEPISSSLNFGQSSLNPEGYVDEDDEAGEPRRPSLINLDEVKKFMVESRAYKQLRESFRSFVFPSEDDIGTVSRPKGMIKIMTTTPYRLHWICVGSHHTENCYHLLTCLKELWL